MVLLLFPSAGKQLEKVLSLNHARGYENAPIFDFKQSDGKLYQNMKQGGYGAYMSLFVMGVFDIMFSPPQFREGRCYIC
ncbi:hypothetical protein BG263_09965 [Streptococcus pneumoniae]|nr:hypothetical protein BG263_09965 [Streptococcus pneumoniae]